MTAPATDSSSLPLVERLRETLSPLEAFERLAGLPYLIFLDSAAEDDAQSRYSYITALPFEVLKTSGDTTEVLEAAGEGKETTYERSGSYSSDPFALLRRRLESWATPSLPGLPPFQAGAAGLLGYGLAHSIEKISRPRHDEFEIPDLAIGLYDWVLAWNHLDGTCHIISHGFPESGPGRLERAARQIDALKKLLDDNASSPRTATAKILPALSRDELSESWEVPEFPGLLSNFSREAYIEAVARSIEYIRAGDIFQVNLSQRLAYPAPSSPENFYLALRKANPAPYAGYFDLGGYVVASSSPEQFLSVEGDQVITRPIKGTCSRGYTPEEDLSRRRNLGQSEKDRAENVMIVDLLRNDISRVCRPHTVEVPGLFEIERHPTVYHLVSEIRGRLREDKDAIDLLRASFPGGSITGAPKVRAMEIIAELEPTARGPYCGSLAWLGFGGGMQSSILIRTVTIGRGWLQMPVGGGIVSDSSPEAEYQETLQKATGMLPALVQSATG